MYDYQSLQHLARQRQDDLLREARAERLARDARPRKDEAEEASRRTRSVAHGLARLVVPAALRSTSAR